MMVRGQPLSVGWLLRQKLFISHLRSTIIFFHISPNRIFIWSSGVASRDGGLEDRPRSRGRPRDLILMASVGLGLGCPCLGLGTGLAGPGFVYRDSRTGLGLEAGLET